MRDLRFTAHTFWLLALATGMLLSVACGGAPLAGEAQSPSERLPMTIVRQMKSSKPRVRAAVVAKLDELPAATAVRLLVEHGLASPFLDLRHASYDALLAKVDDPDVCDDLLERVKKALRKQAADETTCGMLCVLIASELEPVRLATRELLNVVVRQPGGRALLVDLAGELGQQADETSISTLHKLSKLALFEQVFAVRRAVVRALTRSKRPEAINALVEIIGRVDGEVRADIARHLTTISGEPHALDPARWRTWWQASRATFGAKTDSMAVRPAPVYQPLYAAAPTRYYGLPIYAQRLVFVIDTSGSMSGLRLDAAKRELLLAIAGLPPGVWFNVLAFNAGVAAWSDALQVASPANKALAAAYVLAQPAVGATSSYDALVAAMAFDVEAVYFLTDGQPSSGSIINPAEIVTVLTGLNHDRQVSINTLGIGVGPPGSVFDVFLLSLAAANHGEYRRVDQ